MWIRNQSKLKLIECNNITVRHGYGLFSGKYTIEEIKPEYETVLGAYSTEEKAIKVLDALEKHLEYLENKVSGRKAVFHMPQDRDVW